MIYLRVYLALILCKFGNTHAEHMTDLSLDMKLELSYI